MTFISHKYKFIFIEPQKTATTAINDNLKCINLINKDNKESQNLRHVRASKIKSELGESWFNYTSFAVVRNPWERYVSWLMWMHKIIQIKPKEDKARQNIYNVFARNNYRDRDILRHIIERMGTTQYEFLYDNTDLIVNLLLRFENLQYEYDLFCESVNIKHKQLRQLNVSDDYNYKDFYDNELIDLVYNKEKKIIDHTGYSYD